MLQKTLRLVTFVSLCAAGSTGLAGTAWAQTEPGDGTVTPKEPGAAPADPPAKPADAPAAPAAEPSAEPKDPPPALGDAAIKDTGSDVEGEAEEEASVGIRELPDQSYWFLGLRFRNFIVPKFMINIFVEGGATVNAFTFGPELTYRRGPLELDMALSYADYSMDPFMFKEKSEPDRAFEKASSTMKLLVASIDIMANIPIDKQGRFSFLIGGDVGVAGVLGDLRRAQAYPAAYDDDPDTIHTADPDNADEWRECERAGVPPALDEEGSNYCDASNNHYRGYSEPSIANGGGLPFIVPYLALPHLAFRAKPFKDFQARFDTGFSITGFFIGLGAGYRLPI
jgi:hypothetical protein